MNFDCVFMTRTRDRNDRGTIEDIFSLDKIRLAMWIHYRWIFLLWICAYRPLQWSIAFLTVHVHIASNRVSEASLSCAHLFARSNRSSVVRPFSVRSPLILRRSSFQWSGPPFQRPVVIHPANASKVYPRPALEKRLSISASFAIFNPGSTCSVVPA